MSDSISVSAVDKWLNFQLICKPEQSGKTFIMIQHIIKDLSDPMPGKEIINFILCDNNLLLTQQTSGRVKKDLAQAKKDISSLTHQGEHYIELSSHSRTNYHGVDAVFTAILDPRTNARNIICCTNGTRMEDIARLITLINSTIFTSDKFHFNIWLDEADKFTKFIDATLWPIVETYSNVKVKLITATPQPLFQKYKYMNVLPIENTTTDMYHGWEDNCIRIIEKDGGCQVFVDHILSKVAAEAIQAGTKWFIPGLSAKKSHEDIKNICVSKGMAVICVNSDGIVLTLPDTLECVKYTKDDEFNSKIMEIYTEKQLERFAVVITGYICIGRGITIMSENFMIDYAILSHYSNKNEASQLAGRVKGNIKGFSSYNSERPPVIFTKEEFNRVAIEWEHKSRTLAQLAFQKKQNGQHTIVNKAEFKTCDLNIEAEAEEALPTAPSITNCRIYNDEATVKVVCKKLGYQYRATPDNTEGLKIGFKETSLNKTKCVVTLDEAVKKISGGYGKNNKGNAYRTYYPCYTDTNDAATLRFVLIIRPETDPNLVAEVDSMFCSISLV
jgi:hypothetical protein